MTPISGSLFKVQFTASASLIRKLNAAKALSSHRNPTGDLEPLFEQALGLLVKQLEKQRFAKTTTPRKTRSKKAESNQAAVPGNSSKTTRPRKSRPTKSESTQAAVPGNSAAANDKIQSGGPAVEVAKRRSRHIPNTIKRQVYERDAGRCTFVGTDGRRCNETHLLEYEHKLPWARGGGHSLENVVLMCRPHNQLRARQEFPQAVPTAAARGDDRRRSHR